MSRLTPTLCAVFLLASALQSTATADVSEIVSHGQDGDAIYYTVRCTNGAQASVVEYQNPLQICASTPGGIQQCGSWDLQAAAGYACQ